MKSSRSWLVGFSVFALSLSFSLSATGKTPQKKPPRTKSRLLTSQKITAPPTMFAPSRHSSLHSRGKLQLRVKLVYAYTRSRAHIDRPLRKDIPELKHIYGFNAYQLLRSRNYRISYGKKIIVRISDRYQVHLTPKGFDPHTLQISLQAKFFYRKRISQNQTKMVTYATTHLRIKSGKKVAFVGPSHRAGRALLLLKAKLNLPRK